MLHIAERWHSTARELAWQIAYRPKIDGTILDDTATPFNLLNLEDGCWGADPFLFEKDGKTYLFYELFLEKEHKGVIAVSVFDGKGFTAPTTVIEEPFHLSFPCIFTIGDKVYMIPETGSQNAIILYECVDFPYKWQQKKTLLKIESPSDTIVYTKDKEIFVLASILKGSPSSAQNLLYRLDKKALTLNLCATQQDYGNAGFRNAGFLLTYKDGLIRPGQNCPQNDYGKSLYFWKVLKLTDGDFAEEFIKEITCEDIKVNGKFNGIHTYNYLNGFDVIDLRIVIKHNIFKRLSMFFNYCIQFLKNHR